MTELDTVFEEFNSDAERAEHLLMLIKSFREFGGSNKLNPEGGAPLEWPEANSLHRASKDRRTDLPILSASLELYIVGRFEYCIRQLVEAIADELVARANKYADLPDAFRAALKKQSLEIAQNPKKFGYDEAQADALLEKLGRV